MGQRQSSLSTLKPGDHIYRSLKGAAGLYYHHGIFVGEGMVIHFLGPDTDSLKSGPKDSGPCETCGFNGCPNGGVVKTCFDCFACRYPVYLQRSYIRDFSGLFMEKRPDSEVVQTAHKLLEDGFGDYHLVTNNCETFAAFCKTGVKISNQVYNSIPYYWFAQAEYRADVEFGETVRGWFGLRTR